MKRNKSKEGKTTKEINDIMKDNFPSNARQQETIKGQIITT